MAITQADILQQLDNLKKKDRPYLHPQDYKSFLPNTIPNVNQGPDRSIFEAIMDQTLQKSQNQTSIVQTKHQNQLDYEQMREAQAALNRAQNALGSARNMSRPTVRGSGGRIDISQVTGGGKSGHYGPLRGAGVARNLAHFDWNGRKAGGGLTLNASVGNRFVGFLKALSASGYRINSLGSFANRNIAGSSSKSLHAYGLAIDINPTQNPVTYGKPVTNLPQGVGRLAAKYGLVWGGNWNGSKKDTMHFSVPYGGRK